MNRATANSGAEGGRTRAVTRQVSKWIERLLYAVGGATIVLMMLYIVVSAISRTLFGSPLSASLEVVQFWMMPGVASIGFIVATLAHRHVVADIIFHHFPHKARKWLLVANSLLCLTALAVLVWFTWQEAVLASSRNLMAGYTSLPSWPLYFAVSISLLVTAVLFGRDAFVQAHTPADQEPTAEAKADQEQQPGPLAQVKITGKVV